MGIEVGYAACSVTSLGLPRSIKTTGAVVVFVCSRSSKEERAAIDCPGGSSRLRGLASAFSEIEDAPMAVDEDKGLVQVR